jgi:hypothetical protein
MSHPLSDEITARFLAAADRVMQLHPEVDSWYRFAPTVHVTQARSRIEGGEGRTVTPQSLAAICTVYGVNGHWLLTGEGPMFWSDCIETLSKTVYQSLKTLCGSPF